ncbi:hypothetical protein [Mucilaginibacter sp. KACC 22063]|uniref:hypothetical protein n=1 Tax=Mucilaginibacter sp. KACC 22063 TaxID=3025666 RepID=UPI002365351B|nr:hypothetical protein [Mucilaginibacter sp. KACC 22063]WDF54043.1 hypothetical protein PQ461_13940 [Mucilaginibacter sp. KACC 22063]
MKKFVYSSLLIALIGSFTACTKDNSVQPASVKVKKVSIENAKNEIGQADGAKNEIGQADGN